jgi:mono/diheme cytochrome c family protein
LPNQGRPVRAWLLAACSAAFAAAIMACGHAPLDASSDITPVSGPSWIGRLGLSLDRTALGQVGGTTPAPETGRREPRDLSGFFGRSSTSPFLLAGADLYRLNCRACHGPDGLGSPPEITSLLDPVRGTSAELLTRRLEAGGRPVDEAFIKSVTAGAEHDLLKRLAEGGKEMPPFGRLRDDERAALVGYLKQLAGVPEAPRRSRLVRDSPPRVGEQLVNGTCHICHDASGPSAGRMATMMGGATPPLSSFTADYSVQEVVEKVLAGRSARMMPMMMAHASRMPRFPYLTPQEVEAALLFLDDVPPRP